MIVGRSNMKPLLVLLVVALAVPSCKEEVWTPAEAKEWYERWSLPSTVQRGLGYQGSDAVYHYFIARPIDDWVFIKIRREDLRIDDERPRQQVSSASMGVYYSVDPSDGFRKKAPNQPPVPTRGNGT